ncbi:MAG: ribosome maturation factor RimP [Neisseriales bacterium]|jgi:ribosome maturation factor RimP|nr:MAG: ribosome maturation factor RimP [Neisseriales bacterium]
MKLLQILEQTVPGLGYELVDVEITPAKIVRVFIDKEGGVTVEDCADVSNHLSRVLVVEEVDYNRLEISSPGLERPLKKLNDYIRFSGRLAKVKTHEMINNQKVFEGRIIGVEGEEVSLELADKQIFKVAFDDINRGRLIFEPKKK